MEKEQIETERKNCLKFIVIAIPLLFLGFITFALGSLFGDLVPILGFVIFGGGIVFLIIGSTRFEKVRKSIKDEIIPKLVKEIIGEDMNYSASEGLSEDEVCSTRIVTKSDTYHSEDLIWGTFENVEIKSCDVRIEEEHHSSSSNGTSSTTYVPIFVGRYFDFKFPHVFQGEVVASEKKPRTKGLEKCELESVEFNSKFKTYADKSVNAFYILKPQVMEALMRIEQKNPGQVGVQFMSNHVYVAINNNIDTFKISIFKPLSEKDIESFKNDLQCILDLIKEIKSNNIYKEEQ